MLKLSTVFAALLLIATQASAATLTVAWDKNKEAEVAGYIVLLGTASGRTEQQIDVGAATSFTFGTPVVGTIYYFRVLAYTASGLRSAPSTEVSGSVGAAPSTSPPFGAMDTPADGTAGVTGSVAVTGWALDDRGVSRVRIFRGPVSGEQAGVPVYIGDAAFVPGARPDVAAMFPGLSQNDRAGWGYLMLTNFLPNLGNGTFTIYAYADDADGHSTLLGAKTITCANAGATLPFGAIDTPSQGQAVSGVVTNYGWVLSPGTRRADPPGGGTVSVIIDGVRVGSPSGWTSRADLSAFFPASSYRGINTALGVFTFDSRTLTNGLHSIAWAVTDTAHGTAGVGSRYFLVANGSSSTAAVAAAPAAQMLVAATASPALTGRRGFDLTAPYRAYRPDANGFITIQSEELDRIELQTAATSGSLLTLNGPQPLPVGAGLDADGRFAWQPAAGFVGAYDFMFRGHGGDRYVRIQLNPRGSGRVGPQIVIDTPSRAARILAAGQPFVVAGWAADLDDDLGTGVDAVHVWAYPRNGGDPLFLGLAALEGSRPDVGAVYGDRFMPTGYSLTSTGLPAGDYDVAVFAWSTVLGKFAPAQTAGIRVR
jgi:hypothetical protein